MTPLLNASGYDDEFLPNTTIFYDYDNDDTVHVVPSSVASLDPFLDDSRVPPRMDNATLLGNLSARPGVDDRNLTAVALSLSNLPLNTYAVPVVCVTGVVLNCLNLRVLSERCLKESPYTYLGAMALLCLLSLLMTFIHSVFGNFVHIRYNFSWLVFQFNIFFPCMNICTNSIMWLTATLTIERFLFVRHPLWARAACDRRAAKIKVCIILALMTLFLLFQTKTKVCIILALMTLLNIPRFFLYRVRMVRPDMYVCVHTSFRLSQAFVVLSWIYSATIQFIPLAILSVTNSYLVYAVHRARLVRKRLHIRNNREAEWSREQGRLTLTLIAIVFFFIVCIMPSALSDLHVAHVIFARDQPAATFLRSGFYRKWQMASNFLVLCQLSFNFVLYSAFNDKFLSVLQRVAKRWAQALARRGRRRHGNRGRGTLRVDQRTIFTADRARPLCFLNSSLSSKDSSQAKTSTTQTST